MKDILTPTGHIFYDKNHTLECVLVGDYGKENNIKADFLGLFKRIDRVEHSIVDLTEKMVVTISSQKGCRCSCGFCDVPDITYRGNQSVLDMLYMTLHCLYASGVTHTRRLNVHLARCGEPMFNYDAVDQYVGVLNRWRGNGTLPVKVDVLHPVISTMMPLTIDPDNLEAKLSRWCRVKNNRYEFDGEAGLQFSIQSTDDDQRKIMFNGKSHSLDTISNICYRLPKPVGRKYTLNFACDENTIINPNRLVDLFEPENFVVKLTPIHLTSASTRNGYKAQQFDIYDQFEEKLKAVGFDVIVFIPSYEEDNSRITCGNALLADD